MTLPTHEQAEALLGLLPELEAPGATMGSWPDVVGKGVMPFYSFSDLGHRFYRAVHECGFVLPEPDHPRGRAVLEGDIGAATLADICFALTFLARGERFNEGLIDGAFRSGRITAMLRRIRDLGEGPVRLS